MTEGSMCMPEVPQCPTQTVRLRFWPMHCPGPWHIDRHPLTDCHPPLTWTTWEHHVQLAWPLGGPWNVGGSSRGRYDPLDLPSRGTPGSKEKEGRVQAEPWIEREDHHHPFPARTLPRSFLRLTPRKSWHRSVVNHWGPGCLQKGKWIHIYSPLLGCLVTSPSEQAFISNIACSGLVGNRTCPLVYYPLPFFDTQTLVNDTIVSHYFLYFLVSLTCYNLVWILACAASLLQCLVSLDFLPIHIRLIGAIPFTPHTQGKGRNV